MTTDIIEKPKTKRSYNRTKPTKLDPVRAANLINNNGLSVADAAKILNCDRTSIYKALNRNDIDISRYDMDALKNNELDELSIITHEARHHLYKLLQSGKLKGIETTAILDRTFQQRRELQGKGHSSINIFTLIVQKADENIFNVPAKVVDNQQVVQQAVDSTSSNQTNVT